MEMDRRLFAYAEKKLRDGNVLYDREIIAKIQKQIDSLGKTPSDFMQIPAAMRKVVRRAVCAAFGLKNVPTENKILELLHEIYAYAEHTSEPLARAHLHRFAQYISSSAPT